MILNFSFSLLSSSCTLYSIFPLSSSPLPSNTNPPPPHTFLRTHTFYRFSFYSSSSYQLLLILSYLLRFPFYIIFFYLISIHDIVTGGRSCGTEYAPVHEGNKKVIPRIVISRTHSLFLSLSLSLSLFLYFSLSLSLSISTPPLLLFLSLFLSLSMSLSLSALLSLSLSPPLSPPLFFSSSFCLSLFFKYFTPSSYLFFRICNLI